MPKINDAIAKAYMYIWLYEDTCVSDAQRLYIKSITGPDEALEAMSISKAMFGSKTSFTKWYAQPKPKKLYNILKRLTAA